MEMSKELEQALEKLHSYSEKITRHDFTSDIYVMLITIIEEYEKIRPKPRIFEVMQCDCIKINFPCLRIKGDVKNYQCRYYNDNVDWNKVCEYEGKI